MESWEEPMAWLDSEAAGGTPTYTHVHLRRHNLYVSKLGRWKLWFVSDLDLKQPEQGPSSSIGQTDNLEPSIETIVT